MAGKKWSDDTAFNEGGECQIGDKIMGLRSSSGSLANFKFDFPSDGIKDGNGNYLLKWATVGASADNFLQFTNGEAGTPTKIEAAGNDTNISIDVDLKGTGVFDVNGLLNINGSNSINAIIDDDSMASASSNNVPTSESVVAYIGSNAGGAGGSDTEIQYNNSGTLAGDSGFTTNGAGIVSIVGELTVDNLKFAATTIASTNTDGDITFSPNGAGIIQAQSHINLNDNNLQNVARIDFNTSWRFEDATVGSIDRLLFRAQSGNDIAEMALAPIGTAVESRTIWTNNANLTNFSGISVYVNDSSSNIDSFQEGTETVNPLNLQMDGVNVWTVNIDETLSANSNRITNVADPTDAQDAVTLNYFDNNPPGAGGSDTQIQYNNSGSLAGDTGFTTNGAGIVTIVGSLDVDNIKLAGNTISSENTDGNIVLSPNGTASTVTSKALRVQADNTSVFFGAGDDASIQYDGTNFLINPQVVGSGKTVLSAGNLQISSGFIEHSTTSGITASTTQTQGEQPLTTEINEIATVSNPDDVVTLTFAVTGIRQMVINNGANQLQIFPESGDDLGAGVDTSTTLAAGSSQWFTAYDGTNWVQN